MCCEHWYRQARRSLKKRHFLVYDGSAVDWFGDELVLSNLMTILAPLGGNCSVSGNHAGKITVDALFASNFFSGTEVVPTSYHSGDCRLMVGSATGHLSCSWTALRHVSTLLLSMVIDTHLFFFPKLLALLSVNLQISKNWPVGRPRMLLRIGFPGDMSNWL